MMQGRPRNDLALRPLRFATDEEWRTWLREYNRAWAAKKAAGKTKKRKVITAPAPLVKFWRREDARQYFRRFNCPVDRSPEMRHREAPEAVLAEASRAFNAPRSLTQKLLGDPRFGRSALERE